MLLGSLDHLFGAEKTNGLRQAILSSQDKEVQDFLRMELARLLFQEESQPHLALREYQNVVDRRGSLAPSAQFEMVKIYLLSKQRYKAIEACAYLIRTFPEHDLVIHARHTLKAIYAICGLKDAFFATQKELRSDLERANNLNRLDVNSIRAQFLIDEGKISQGIQLMEDELEVAVREGASEADIADMIRYIDHHRKQPK